MFLKILVLILVLVVLYFIFFNKSLKKSKKEHKKDKKISSETMVECAKCGVYVSANEAIIKDGKYYCSSECANGNS